MKDENLWEIGVCSISHEEKPLTPSLLCDMTLQSKIKYCYYQTCVLSEFLMITLAIPPYRWERKKRSPQLDFLYMLRMEHKTRICFRWLLSPCLQLTALHLRAHLFFFPHYNLHKWNVDKTLIIFYFCNSHLKKDKQIQVKYFCF